MNQALVDKIVQAVLYEGYVLYPYRPSSVKNRQRWTFGGIYPRSYSDSTGGSEPWRMQAQCLVSDSEGPAIHAQIRFLQLTNRTTLPEAEIWQEAAERKIDLAPAKLADLLERPRTLEFTFPAQRVIEASEGAAGSIVREQQAISGAAVLSAERKAHDLFRFTVRVENLTATKCPDGGADRDAASLQSFASTHVILNAMEGNFVSITDPPESLAAAARDCNNVGCWPVLVGESGERDMLLASPIILCDYPQVAAESPGDLFDATEIDEILSLRIMTLTDEEKRQAAATDERVREMLARTDALARDQLMSLHGTIRGMSSAIPPEQRHD